MHSKFPEEGSYHPRLADQPGWRSSLCFTKLRRLKTGSALREDDHSHINSISS